LVCTTEFDAFKTQNKIEFDTSKITDQFKQFLGNTNGMWIIERPVYKEGGLIKWNEPYRFKHLSSGLYLSVKRNRRKDEKERVMKMELESKPTPETLFKFLPIASTQTKQNPQTKYFVMRDTFVLLVHAETKVVVHATLERDNFTKKNLQVTEDSGEKNLFGVVKPSL
jgi:hypothetical protein